MTDASISALSAGCGKLQSINLEGCRSVTDAGVSALSAGCGQLHSINLEGCDNVTNAQVYQRWPTDVVSCAVSI